MRFRDYQRIPEICTERFLPVDEPSLHILTSQGLRLGGLSELRSGTLVERPANRPWHIVIATAAGEGVIEYEDGSKHRVGPYDVFISPANAGGHRHYPLEDYWKIAWFNLKNDEHWSAVLDQRNTIRGGKRIAVLTDALASILREYFSSFHGSDRLIELYSEIVLIELRRELLSGSSPVQDAIHYRLNALWETVNANLADSWTVEKMAAHTGLSRTHFFRNCRALYSMTPTDRVRELRLNRAESLLTYFDFPIALVAELVGYESIYSFSNVFRKYRGVSPSRFRKHSRERLASETTPTDRPQESA